MAAHQSDVHRLQHEHAETKRQAEARLQVELQRQQQLFDDASARTAKEMQAKQTLVAQCEASKSAMDVHYRNELDKMQVRCCWL